MSKIYYNPINMAKHHDFKCFNNQIIISDADLSYGMDRSEVAGVNFPRRSTTL